MNLLLAFYMTAVLHAFSYDWMVPDVHDWQVTGNGSSTVLVLKTGKEPPASGPRRPQQFAVAQTSPFSHVKVEADVEPLGKSLMIVFAYRDAAHFNYAHLSMGPAKAQSHHNGIFHVYEGERVRISSEDGPSAFSASGKWYHVVLTHDGKSGEVNVTVDGKSVPALHAVDLSLTSGQIGIGSFDETAAFKNVRITSGP